MKRAVVPLIALLMTTTASAVQFKGVQTGTNTWTYELIYEPYDNYNVCDAATTITLTGLTGVTAAAGPTATDFTPTGGAGDLNNKAWTAQILDGGTKVVWTNTVGGTGNYSTAKHVYGFTITASAGASAPVPFITGGFVKDGACPASDRDIIGEVPGPNTATANDIRPENGLWAVNAELGASGRGFQLEMRDGIMVLTYYGYDNSGKDIWHLAAGPVTGSTFSATMDTYNGGPHLGGPATPATKTGNAGVVSITFTSARTGTITFPGESAKAISKYMW